MNRRRTGGFTLLEMMVVVGIVSAFFAFTYATITNTARVVSMESTQLTMDQHANQALQRVADALRPAILPIPVGGDGSRVTEFAHNVLNNAKLGFNNANGRRWLEALQIGTDCIAFTVPVDYGNDGDTVDSEGYIELGMVLPSGKKEYGAEYKLENISGVSDEEGGDEDGGTSSSTRKANYLNGNPVNRYLRTLNPASDLDIKDNVTEISGNEARFATNFTFPRNGEAYALVRFVPYRVDGETRVFEGGKPLELSEAALRYDLNGDGDQTDTFILGYMELTYSDVRIPISGPSVLLQKNVNDKGWIPMFKLVRYESTDNALNDYDDGFDASTIDGEYGILIRLLMCDSLGQTNPLVFQRRVPAIVRRFETLVKLRNLTITNIG